MGCSSPRARVRTSMDAAAHPEQVDLADATVGELERLVGDYRKIFDEATADDAAPSLSFLLDFLSGMAADLRKAKSEIAALVERRLDEDMILLQES